jgi:hypothetical protein
VDARGELVLPLAEHLLDTVTAELQ